MSYEINYEDQKFKDVEADKKQAISDLEKTYGGMVNDSDSYYKAQVDASNEWEKKQTELQNQQTDFAIKEIEQKKDQAKKDYTKEQSGAYVDWQKQSNEFGTEAEQRAAQGLENTGFSESSKVSMYNTYQNRVATARESYNRIVLDFDNAITNARLQNNSALAEIAYKSLQQRLELNLQGFQYKNSLLLEQAKRKTELEQMYHERWQDVLNQMNTENALAEEMRQFNAQLAEQQRQFDLNFNRYSGGGGSSGGGGGSSRSYSSSGGSSSSGSKINKSNSSGGGMAKDTADSILALGQGPISESNLNNQINSGKVSVSQSTKTGNPIVSYSGIKTTSSGSSSSSKSSSSSSKSSSSSSSGSWISKAVNTVKSWFK